MVAPTYLLDRRCKHRSHYPAVCNSPNGDFRCGYLDLPMVRYAVDCCEKFGPVDGLLVSHLDHTPDRLCVGYELGKTGYGLTAQAPNLARQERIGAELERCLCDLVDTDWEKTLEALYAIRPVSGTAVGPTFKDRLFAAELPFRRLS